MNSKLYFFNWISIVFFTLLILLLMHPFLKYPFDMYHHLLHIEDYYTNNHIPTVNKFFWHYWWSKVFHFFNIDNTKLFERAYIIHYTQVLVTYFSVYYFSYTLLKYTLPKLERLYWNILAAWATLIWFTIYATASVGYHLVWIQWYSITYQISLPLTLLSMGFLLNFLYSKNIIRYLYLLISIIIISIVLIIHSPEFIYFLMYITLLFIVYIDKIFKYLKDNIIFSILLTVLLFIIVLNFDKIVLLVPKITNKMPKLLEYIINNDLDGLWNNILRDGNLLIHRFNRAKDSFNELMIVSLYFLIPILFISVYLKKFHKIINLRLIFFIFGSSLFVLIPLYQITAGVSSLLTYMEIANRFYYSSTIFLVIPLFVILVFYLINKENNLFLVSIFIATILLLVFYYSRYAVNTPQNYYRNIQSIKNAWDQRRVGFNLSKNQINIIGKKIEDYELKYGKNIIFFAREDIGFIIKHIYKKDVYLPIKWVGKRLDKDFYIKAYNTKDINKTKILFKTPKDFPKYEPYK